MKKLIMAMFISLLIGCVSGASARTVEKFVQLGDIAVEVSFLRFVEIKFISAGKMCAYVAEGRTDNGITIPICRSEGEVHLVLYNKKIMMKYNGDYKLYVSYEE